MEADYRSAIVVSIVLEGVTIALLGAHLLLREAPAAPIRPTVAARPSRTT
jgi:hypothetical protein